MRGLVSFFAAAGIVLAVLANAHGSAAEPRVLASLLETGGTDSAQPWPAGLRIVLYDSGEILRLDRPHSDTTNDRIVVGAMRQEAVNTFVAGLSRRLAGVTEYLSAAPTRTILQVWDAERQTYFLSQIDGHPCSSPKDAASGSAEDWRVAFLEVCASLLAVEPPGWKPWSPTQLWIDLEPSSAGEAQPWPAGLGSELIRPNVIFACAAGPGNAGDLVFRLMSDKVAMRRSALSASVQSADGKVWKITHVGYALPGGLGYTFAPKSDSPMSWEVARGPCHAFE